MAVAAHYQQFGVQLAAFLDQHVGGLVFFTKRSVLDGIDAVMPKMLYGIVSHEEVCPLRVLTFDDEEADFLSLMQIRHGLGQGAGRLSFHATIACFQKESALRSFGTRKRWRPVPKSTRSIKRSRLLD